METSRREPEPTWAPGIHPHAGHHDRLLGCGWAQPLLTIHPADADTLKDGHKEKAHPAGGIGVEELEDVHAALQSGRTHTWMEGCKDTWESRVGQLASERPFARPCGYHQPRATSTRADCFFLVSQNTPFALGHPLR